MFEKFNDIDYHPSLIDIMVKGSLSGAFIVNIFTPVLLAYAYEEYISFFYLAIWLLLNVVMYIARVTLIKRISYLNSKPNSDMKIHIQFLLFVVVLTAVLYGGALIYSYLKVPDLELFLMGTLIVSMIAGSISTLVGVFHAFAVYVLLNSFSIVTVFFYHGGKMFEIFAITTFIFMIVMLKNGYKQYLSLKENILLKETFESRVQQSIVEIEDKNTKLNESLHNFQDLIETSMVMIAFHSEDGLLISMNKSALLKFGYKSIDDVKGVPITAVLPEKSIPIVKEALKSDVSEPYELIMKKQDGTEFPTLISAKYIIHDGARVRMTTMMDLSELKSKERLIQHQSKLAQMGEMISMIAHQWRQPLSAISATSAALSLKAQLDKADNKTIEEMTAKISVYAQHLSDTIDDFRNFFKPNKSVELLSYSKLVHSVLDIVEESIVNKNIKLVLNLKCEAEFYSFSNELKQVILNLIKNAEEALHDNEIKNPYIKIATFKGAEENNYILEISDNAGGIDNAILDKVFEPYFSTKLEKNGSGLGLYMSKTIVEDHCRGKLLVKNTKEGALFSIVLKDDLVSS